MTEAKHTPGPWIKAERLNGPWWHISSEYTIGGYRCIGGRQAIACVHGESKRGSVAYSEMFEANARLIAAAPDMLEALNLCRQHMYEHASNTQDNAFEKLCAAIAKATGN